MSEEKKIIWIDANVLLRPQNSTGALSFREKLVVLYYRAVGDVEMWFAWRKAKRFDKKARKKG